MTDTKKAGALILENLGMFNEAALLMEKIEKKVNEAFNNVVKSWAAEQRWDGEFTWGGGDDYTWVAAPEWNLGDEQENDYRIKFMFDYMEDLGASYALAYMCGLAETRTGFMLELKTSAFGRGGKRWKEAVRGQAEILSQLQAMDFDLADSRNGLLFLPVILSAEQLAVDWDNDDYSVALSPVVDALDKIKQALPLINKLVEIAEPE